MSLKRYISAAFTLFFVGLFIWYGINNQEELSELEQAGISGLLLVAAGKIVVFASNGLFTKWSAEAFTKKLSVGEGAYISILSAIGNFFGPLLGGTSIRAVYLKKYHGLAYSKFASTLIWYYLILFVLVAFMAIISLVFLGETNQTASLIVFFLVWLVVLLGLMIIKPPKLKLSSGLQKNRAVQFISKVLVDINSGREIISRNKNLLSKLFLVSFISMSANFFISYVEFSLLDISISLPALGLYTALVSISLLISLTPGAIGIREGILLVVASTMGITADDIVKVAVIDRGVHFILLAGLFMITRNSRLKKSLTEKEVVV